MTPPPGYREVHEASLAGFGSSIGPLFLDPAARRMAMRVGPEHVNAMNVCHGGAVATFADSQIAVLKAADVVPRCHTPTISLNVDFMAPAPPGSLLEMTVVLASVTRNLIFTQSTITVADVVIARSHAIYRRS